MVNNQMMKTRAKELGISFTLPVKDSFRQSGCTASVMELVAIEGEHAIYRGVCIQRHQYEQRVLVESLKQKNVTEVEDFKLNEEGKLEIGDGKGFANTGLEDF